MPKLNKNKGVISKKSRTLITNYVGLLFDASVQKRVWDNTQKSYFNYRIGFITLTLPSLQIHSDREIHKECFKVFIRQVKVSHPHFLYLWKAEVQENGNLHYHITTNSFLHYQYVQDVWNGAINRLGYVDRCKSDNPHSTEIRAVKNEKMLAIYLANYLTKNKDYKKSLCLSCDLKSSHFYHQQNFMWEDIKGKWSAVKRAVDLKLWDCSEILKEQKTSCKMDWEQESELMRNHESLLAKEGENLYVYAVNKEDWELIPHVMKVYSDAVLACRKYTSIESKTHVLPARKPVSISLS